MRERVTGIAKELSRPGTVADAARERLLKTRQLLLSAWMKTAHVLDAQGEVILAGDVRYFAKHLPPVLTDRQRLAAQFIRLAEKRRGIKQAGLSTATLRTASERSKRPSRMVRYSLVN